MAQPLEATCPTIVLNDGCRVVLEAIDPDNGEAIAGVVVSSIAIYGDPDDADTTTVLAGPFLLVPGPDSAIG